MSEEAARYLHLGKTSGRSSEEAWQDLQRLMVEADFDPSCLEDTARSGDEETASVDF
jgi:hypothetical protein